MVKCHNLWLEYDKAEISVSFDREAVLMRQEEWSKLVEALYGPQKRDFFITIKWHLFISRTYSYIVSKTKLIIVLFLLFGLLHGK